jgi:hypothetical protein
VKVYGSEREPKIVPMHQPVANLIHPSGKFSGVIQYEVTPRVEGSMFRVQRFNSVRSLSLNFEL